MIEDGVERASCLTHLDSDIEYTSEDGVFMKGMLIPKAGTVVHQHSHKYAHTSLLALGRVEVSVGGGAGVQYTAPAFIHVPADTMHEFKSLCDNTHVFCIHNIKEAGAVLISGFNKGGV